MMKWKWVMIHRYNIVSEIEISNRKKLTSNLKRKCPVDFSSQNHLLEFIQKIKDFNIKIEIHFFVQNFVFSFDRIFLLFAHDYRQTMRKNTVLTEQLISNEASNSVWEHNKTKFLKIVTRGLWGHCAKLFFHQKGCEQIRVENSNTVISNLYLRNTISRFEIRDSNLQNRLQMTNLWLSTLAPSITTS